MNSIQRQKDNSPTGSKIPLNSKKPMTFSKVDRCFLVSLTKGRQNSKTADDCFPHGEHCYKSWK